MPKNVRVCGLWSGLVKCVSLAQYTSEIQRDESARRIWYKTIVNNPLDLEIWMLCNTTRELKCDIGSLIYMP